MVRCLGPARCGVFPARWFLEDLNYDRSFNNRDRTFVRGQLVFEPSDTVRLRLIGDYSDRDEICCAAVGLIAGPTAPSIHQIAQAQTRNPNTVGIAFDPYARGATVTEDSGYYQAVEEGGLSLEIDADLPFARLVSVTATRNWDTAREMDIDFSAMDMGERPIGEFTLGFETLTQEIRLNGQSGPLDWLVGAYYADESLPYRDAAGFRDRLQFLCQRYRHRGCRRGRRRVRCVSRTGPNRRVAGGCGRNRPGRRGVVRRIGSLCSVFPARFRGADALGDVAVLSGLSVQSLAGV